MEGAIGGSLDRKGDAYTDVAEVLTIAGEPAEAAEALDRAIDYYTRKGDIAATHQARMRVAALGEEASL